MAGHERTEDGHHLIIKGRKWRASDPAIPAPLHQELVTELMTARRLIKSRGDEGRFRVDDAKVALGERGEPWWEPSTHGQRERLGAAVRALLRKREGSTICPSDAARVVGGENWRELMPLARDVAADLAGSGEVRITQRGDEVPADASGPIRLAPGPQLQR